MYSHMRISIIRKIPTTDILLEEESSLKKIKLYIFSRLHNSTYNIH